MGLIHPRNQNTTDVWLTPPELIHALGEFDLDPCAACDRPWNTAQHHYCIHDDGLTQPWSGLVWMNPPYGRQTGVWLDRLAKHPDGGIALVFARTDTAWAHDSVFGVATSALFMRGRIRFHRANGERANQPAAPSWLIAYGDEAHQRLRHSHIEGHTVRLN